MYTWDMVIWQQYTLCCIIHDMLHRNVLRTRGHNMEVTQVIQVTVGVGSIVEPPHTRAELGQ